MGRRNVQAARPLIGHQKGGPTKTKNTKEKHSPSDSEPQLLLVVAVRWLLGKQMSNYRTD